MDTTNKESNPKKEFNGSVWISDIRWGKPTAEEATIYNAYGEEFGTIRVLLPKEEGKEREYFLLDVDGKVLHRTKSKEEIAKIPFEWEYRKKLAFARRQKDKKAFFELGDNNKKKNEVSRKR